MTAPSMTSNRRIRAAASLLALPLVAAFTFTSCSGDDDDDTATTDGGSATLVSTPDETGTAVPTDGTTEGSAAGPADEEAFVDASAAALVLGDEEMSRCVSQALIDTIGMDRITASGVTPEEFTNAPTLSEVGLAIDEAAIPDLTSSLSGCGDLVEGLVSGAPTQAQANCVRDELTNDLAAELIVSQLAEQPMSAELQSASDAARDCADAAAPATTG